MVERMVYRALYHKTELADPEVAAVLAVDNLVERGYTLQDAARMGFSLPDTPELPLLMAGVTKGKARHTRALQRDAERKGRMSS